MAHTSSLLKQLAQRAQRWLPANTNITQAAMAHAFGLAGSNYNSFLKGAKGLSAEATCKLLEILSLPANKVVAKFCKPATSRILKLQERGKKVRLSNDGWVPRQGGTDDPVDSTSISNTRSAVNIASVADIVAAISRLDPFTQQAVIDEVVQAYPNRQGVTSANGQRFSR